MSPWLGVRVGLVLSLALGVACSSSSDGPSDPAPPPSGPTVQPPPPPSEAPDGTDYLVITADSLAASADRFRAYRASTSHHVVVATLSHVVNGATGADAVHAIHEYVRGAFAKRDTKKPFYVLVLGDASPADAPVGAGEVPAGTFVDSGGSNVTTDNFYADMDLDHIPDLAVGRVAVRTDAEADVVLDKVKRYESTYEVGAWNHRINLFASTSGFGDLVDPQIEEVTFKVVEEIPYTWDITLTYAKQTSPYVFVPERFSDKVYERMNEGALMMAYVGHGDTTGFATLDWSGRSFPILDTGKVSKIAAVHRPPILTLIACLTGGFEKGESISEQILKTKDGPSAILSSTEISHPYANAIFIRELAQVLTKNKPATIGEIFVEGKRRMISNNDALRRELDGRVGALVPEDERPSLRESHLYMYTLLGDPALRIPYVRESADVTAPASIKAGQELAVSAKIPATLHDGRAHVTFERSRVVDSPLLKPVPADGMATRDGVIEANYAAENDRAAVTVEAMFANGALSAKIAVPADLAAGTYYVKIYAEDGKSDAMGSATVSVSAP